MSIENVELQVAKRRRIAQEKAMFPEREKAFALDIIQRKYWSFDDIFYIHRGFGITPSSYHDADPSSIFKNNPDLSFYQRVNPRARPNPHDGYLSLHIVHRLSAEFNEVMAMAQTNSNYDGTIASIIRVQNYPLMDTFTKFYTSNTAAMMDTTDNLGVGFHSAGCFEYIENILLNGLNPAISSSGKLGRGSYLASNAAYSLETYGNIFQTPLYMDTRGQPCIDEYKIVVFCCLNKGHTKINTEGLLHATLPPGCGAFVEKLNNPTVYCIQEFQRAYPAYMMVYKLPRNQEKMQINIEVAEECDRAQVDMSGVWTWPSDTVGLRVFTNAAKLHMDDKTTNSSHY